MSAVMDPPGPPQRRGGVALTLGAVFLIAGLVLGGVLVFRGVREVVETVDGYQRVSASTGGTVTLEETGTHRLFFEVRGYSGDVSTMGYTPAVITGPDGESIPLGYVAANETYNFGNRRGRKMGSFQVRTPGPHQITPLRFDDFGSEFEGMFPDGGRSYYAVGTKSPVSGLMPLLGGVLGGGAVAVLGVVLLIVGGVLRSRSNKEASAPLAGWPAPPQAQTWNPAAPQPWTPPGSGTWQGPGPPPPPPPPGSMPPPAPMAPPPASTPDGSPGWAPRAWESPTEPGGRPPGDPS